MQRDLQREQIGEPASGRRPDRLGGAEVPVLIHDGDPQPPAARRDGPLVGITQALDQLHEGGLAAAVAPDDAPAIAPLDQEGDPVEQRSVAEVDGSRGDGDERHGGKIDARNAATYRTRNSSACRW